MQILLEYFPQREIIKTARSVVQIYGTNKTH